MLPKANQGLPVSPGWLTSPGLLQTAQLADQFLYAVCPLSWPLMKAERMLDKDLEFYTIKNNQVFQLKI